MYELKDFKKAIYGKHVAALFNEFHDGLHTIEKNNAKYFSSKTSLRHSQSPNQLRYHYYTSYNGKVFGFGILSDSDLEEHIILECKILFNQVFLIKLNKP